MISTFHEALGLNHDDLFAYQSYKNILRVRPWFVANHVTSGQTHAQRPLWTVECLNCFSVFIGVFCACFFML